MSDTILTQQMTDLPVNGREFTQIQQLVPGASRTMGDEGGTGFNSSRGFALNGQQEQATGFEVDGVENTDMGNGTGSLTTPGLEAISEIKGRSGTESRGVREIQVKVSSRLEQQPSGEQIRHHGQD